MLNGKLDSIYDLTTVSHTYRKGVIAGSVELDQMLERVTALIRGSLGNRDACSVLDVGCGAGGFYGLLANRFGDDIGRIRYTGVDASARQIAFAKEDGKDGGAIFQLADAEALPFADDSFDLVYETRVMEFLQHPLRALAGMLRISRRPLFSIVPTHARECVSLAPFFTPVSVGADGQVAENASLKEIGAEELFVDLLSPTDEAGKFYYAFCKHLRCLISHEALGEFLEGAGCEIVSHEIRDYPQPNISSSEVCSGTVVAGDKLEYLPVRLNLLTLAP